MGKQITEPMNLELLILTPNIISRLGEVKSRDTFQQNSTEFHPEGLFSTVIFGPVGSKERMERMGYISLGLKVFHPRVYIELTSMSSLYKGILEGTKYAIFDPKLKDFVETDKLEGSTGYKLFFKYYDQIDFPVTNSLKRKFKKLFLTKYSLKEVTIDKYLVIPAGLRDYIVTESGKVLENEINNIYRRLLTVSQTAKQFKEDTSDETFINNIRNRLQNLVVDIYKYIETMLDGKSKFIQGKWLKRSLLYGTRNVITGLSTPSTRLDEPHRPKTYHTYVGIIQAAKGIYPVTVFQLRSKFLDSIFDPASDQAYLINKKTYKLEPVKLSEKARSAWISDEGLEEVINKLIQDEIFKTIIEVDNHYLYLVYDNGNEIIVFRDKDRIKQMKPDIDESKIRPITYGELLYLTLFDIIEDYPAYITRYPITGYGSTDPTIPYLKPTVKTKKVKILLPGSTEYKFAYMYPILESAPFKSLSIPFYLLEGLGADYDGEIFRCHNF